MFEKDDWKMGFTRRPKKEKPLRISFGSGRTNFNRASGKFGGNKTWSVSVMAKVISGAKNKGRSGAFAKYIERPEECLAAYGDEKSVRKFNELDEKLLSQNPKRVIQKQLVIPVPAEFLKKPDELMKKIGEKFENKYFDVCYTWNMALHQGGEDFKNPHIHVIFSTVDENYKNIRQFDKSNKEFLKSIKKDVRDFITQELGIKAEVKEYKTKNEKGGIKHYPKWVANAYKRAEQAEAAGDGGKMFKEYAQRYPIFDEYLSERRRKKIEKNIADLDLEGTEKISEIKKKARKIINKDKATRDYFTKNSKEIDAEAAQAEDRVKAKYQTLHPEPKINPDRPENLKPEPEAAKTKDPKPTTTEEIKLKQEIKSESLKQETENKNQKNIKPEDKKMFGYVDENLAKFTKQVMEIRNAFTFVTETKDKFTTKLRMFRPAALKENATGKLMELNKARVESLRDALGSYNPTFSKEKGAWEFDKDKEGMWRIDTLDWIAKDKEKQNKIINQIAKKGPQL